MAARESDGLKIALIIFVMLTILLSVSTYMLLTRFNEATQKATTADTAAKTAADDKVKAEAGKTALAQLIGAAATDDPDAIVKEGREEITKQQAYSLGALPEDQRTYRKLVEALTTTITAKNDLISSGDVQRGQLEGEKAAIQAKAVAREQELEKALKTTQDDSAAEVTKYAAAVAELKTTEAGLVDDKNAKNKAMDEMKAHYERQLAEVTSSEQKAKRDLLEIKKIFSIYTSAGGIASAGGKITWVDQRNSIAYINLGSDDGLRRRITFSVYPPDTTDVSKATPKGKVEVLNVSDSHQAEVRITENPLGDPILPGDVIHTIGWHPGQHEHYTIGGFIDIDGDGNAQTRKLIDLIVANGGIIDAYVDEKGKVTGTTTVNTRYLVMGEMNPDKPGAVPYIGATTKLIDDAKRLGVEQVGLTKFLGMMGYTARSAIGSGYRTTTGAAAGPGAAPRGAAEKPADDNGGFRPRKPPADDNG